MFIGPKRSRYSGIGQGPDPLHRHAGTEIAALSVTGMRPVCSLTLIVLLCLALGCARTPEQRYSRSLERGKQLSAAGDYSRAILEFRNAVEAQPNKPEGHYRLAEAYVATRQFNYAIYFLRKATAADPNFAPAQVKLAELMTMTHDPQAVKDAESLLMKVLTRDPGDSTALYVLAATQMQSGNVKNAEKSLTEILEKSPQNLRSAISLAQLKASQHDLAAAESILQAAVRQLPESSHAAVALGFVYAWAGKTAEARSTFERAVQLDRTNAGALQALAAIELKTGDTAAAEATYRQLASVPNKDYHLAYAMFLLDQKRASEAVAELERLFRSDPGDRVARTGLVAGYLATNRENDAAAVLATALKANPNDADALSQRSQIYLHAGKYNEAQRDLENVLHSTPSAQAHYLMSKVYAQRGAFLLEKQELGEALRLSPESFLVRTDLANALLRSRNPRAALDTLRGATDQQQRTVAYVEARNWALIALGEYAEARKGVEAALAVARTPELRLQDAVLKSAARDLPGARAAIDEVLKENPEDLRALSLYVQMSGADKQSSAVLDKMRQCIALRPKSIQLRMFLAVWLVEHGREPEARQALAEAKAIATDNPTPDLMLAGLDIRAGKTSEARQKLTALLAADPSNIEAHRMFGDLEDAAKNYEGAAEHYRKVIDTRSDDIHSLNNLAFNLSNIPDRLDEAMGYAQKAKELVPTSPEIQDTLGWIYYKKGLYSMAVKEFELAAARKPTPEINFHLGMAYKQLGKSEEGSRLVEEAVAKDPTLLR